MANYDFNNPYYPYDKPNGGYNTLRGAEEIPYKLITYLMDLPDRNGYEPVDDNERPRVRLAKYLWYDEPNPLSMPLPTPEEKLSMLYDGHNAMISTEEDKKNHPKGYRLQSVNYTEASELEARVLLKCYMGRVIGRTEFKTTLGVTFEIVVNYALDNVTRTSVYSRMYAIFQCLVEALHGVNIAGVGPIYFSKPVHGDVGYTTYHSEGTQTYATIGMAIDWQEGGLPYDVVTDF